MIKYFKVFSKKKNVSFSKCFSHHGNKLGLMCRVTLLWTSNPSRGWGREILQKPGWPDGPLGSYSLYADFHQSNFLLSII